MDKRYALLFLLAAAASLSLAQQPPPPPPVFAASNLSPTGVRGLAANCSSCHGTNGRTVPGSAVSGLAGYEKDRLVAAMKEFREGKRQPTIMHQIARGYSDAETEAMADYFSKQSR
jgi:sulfide dehydrogenase cytochrome subunit